MIIRCIIVDDEQPARDELRYLLSSFTDIEITGDVDSVGKAVSLIEKTSPDLVFLDIQMPGRTGFDLIKTLSLKAQMPLFVFVTAYDNYAVEAFEKSAIDYLLKPLSVKRLALTIERVRRYVREETQGTIQDKLQTLLAQMAGPKEAVRVSVENNGRMQLLSPEEIVYCSYESGRILVHTVTEEYPVYSISTMDKLAEHLVGCSFFRAHRGVLVNLDCIREFSPWFNGKYNLIMSDDKGTELVVSRTRVKDFKKRLGI
ncbi:response regulator transcription factor [Desulfopila sp. IMCC35006]|uniref:LytR/AlgR family response regulator transcription factor n=1 Tax=Desulfopila sp. IMCC35006 TaxID=2569542 RepID=UPI0010AD3D71|nr:LytTR family DNA-binding domain-containing protein [Desulfopila sp. IMCC35006]TKB27568.1 response regulator transcription factor [Desulfopila sp. IMCC35006]